MKNSLEVTIRAETEISDADSGVAGGETAVDSSPRLCPNEQG